MIDYKDIKYKTPPLPFIGNKRNQLKSFYEHMQGFSDKTIFIDVFGGSGLLANTVKQMYPRNQVVYNDFDDYNSRLKKIEKTNAIIEDMRHLLKENNIKCYEKIQGGIREKLLEIIDEQLDRLDIVTLSTFFIFSGLQTNYNFGTIDFLKKSTLYNRLREKKYNANQYLNDVHFLRANYSDVFLKFKDIDNCFFICDPPYLFASKGHYSENFSIRKTMELLKFLNGRGFILFNSAASEIDCLMELAGINNFKLVTTPMNYGGDQVMAIKK